MSPAALFDRPPRDDGPAIERAQSLAILRHRDGRDYSRFQLAGGPPAEPTAGPMFDLDDYAAPDHGPAPMPGQLPLGQDDDEETTP